MISLLVGNELQARKLAWVGVISPLDGRLMVNANT